MINPHVFHGWRIVTAGFVLEMLMGALLFRAYGAYVVLLLAGAGPTAVTAAAKKLTTLRPRG